MNSQEEAFRRQSDRSVDNLRSLYAVVFGLSFGLVFTGAYDKAHSGLVGLSFDPARFALHALVTFSFVVTLSLFHYQTDRYLDVIYRRNGLVEVRPPLFLLDLVRGLLAMAPIFLMAQALSAEAFEQVGFTWFVLAGSLFLLANTLFLSWPSGSRPGASPETPDPQADAIDAVRVFWLLLNSASMFVLFGLYTVFRSAGEVCPARGEAGLQPGFVALFCLVLLARDMIDISQSWSVLHPATAGPKPTPPGRLLSWLSLPARRRRIRNVALTLAIVTVVLAGQAGLLDILAVTRHCMTR